MASCSQRLATFFVFVRVTRIRPLISSREHPLLLGSIVVFIVGDERCYLGPDQLLRAFFALDRQLLLLWPVHDTARLTEAFRRAVLRLFVRFQAAGMLTWPHSGFHVHTAVCVPEDDRAFATRLARYCARNPVALEVDRVTTTNARPATRTPSATQSQRLTYDRTAKSVTYRSDKAEDPTAGTESVDPLEFLARSWCTFRHGPRHHAVLWLGRPPSARDAASG